MLLQAYQSRPEVKRCASAAACVRQEAAEAKELAEKAKDMATAKLWANQKKAADRRSEIDELRARRQAFAMPQSCCTPTGLLLELEEAPALMLLLYSQLCSSPCLTACKSARRWQDAAERDARNKEAAVHERQAAVQADLAEARSAQGCQSCAGPGCSGHFFFLSIVSSSQPAALLLLVLGSMHAA